MIESWTPNFSQHLLESLLQQFPCETFIETGSGQGFTPLCVEPYFEKLFTCDVSPEYHQTAWRNALEHQKIKTYLGDSPAFLSLLRPSLTGRTMFWLDAHDDTPGAFGWENPEPLIDELRAIDGLRGVDVVMIDDVRMFVNPNDSLYPLPGCIVRFMEYWPDINSRIVGDVLVLTPKEFHYEDD